ncbi:BolA family protein [Thalassorhabdomicrobium marinisediminis]|uniref:BolA family transcriptional regulator n=1 Tax=Thalassorhabdomicrobium marinisediminis TaxID=2170577 RepID=A0A2T7FXZ8_9RHOB|nr:BolA family protein [Thalassorhabdomicrobium marinisediminis]PVA07035.1 BolA family transcriptional regulator [Thalassorhabdomicrobium marinisediminis]
MSMEAEIRRALEGRFSPTSLAVINESHLHAGHAGDDGSGESHWRIEMTAPELAGASRIAKHRAIHDALGPEIIGRIHALSLQID